AWGGGGGVFGLVAVRARFNAGGGLASAGSDAPDFAGLDRLAGELRRDPLEILRAQLLGRLQPVAAPEDALAFQCEHDRLPPHCRPAKSQLNRTVAALVWQLARRSCAP